MRRGHSLAELLVALTLLGVGLAATESAMLAALRRTGDAIQRERAGVHAAAVLDSLVMTAEPVPGSRPEAGFELSWSLEAAQGGLLVRVEVRLPGRPAEPLRLEGRHLGPVPVIAPGP